MSSDATTRGPKKQALPVSVAIVCKNSEATIGRTLDSVASLAAEIIAIDSGSTDATLDMLEEAGARIIQHKWLGFGPTKQLAMESCAQDWVLNLDSDESLEPELEQSIRDAFADTEISSVDGFEMNRKIFWNGAWLHHAWQPEWRLRLVRRSKFRWGGYEPHNTLLPNEGADVRVERVFGDLRHESFQSMADHLDAQARYARSASDSYLRQGRKTRPLRMVGSTVGAFMKQMILRSAWRDGWRGWSAAGATAAATLMKHLVLLEKQHDANDRDHSDEQQ